MGHLVKFTKSCYFFAHDLDILLMSVVGNSTHSIYIKLFRDWGNIP